MFLCCLWWSCKIIQHTTANVLGRSDVHTLVTQKDLLEWPQDRRHEIYVVCRIQDVWSAVSGCTCSDHVCKCSEQVANILGDIFFFLSARCNTHTHILFPQIPPPLFLITHFILFRFRILLDHFALYRTVNYNRQDEKKYVRQTKNPDIDRA